MQKMGYIIGHGLGKDGRGRAEPVPIQLLPQGTVNFNMILSVLFHTQ